MKHIICSFFILILTLGSLSACSTSGLNVERDYPMKPEDERRLRGGKLTGEGIKFGGDRKRNRSEGSGVRLSGLIVILWRATLDTIAFMPLVSADPFGGVVITDWYEDPATPKERFKLNVTILDKQLTANAVKVSAFKQILDDKGNWRDAAIDPSITSDLESKILTRARELRIKDL